MQQKTPSGSNKPFRTFTRLGGANWLLTVYDLIFGPRRPQKHYNQRNRHITAKVMNHSGNEFSLAMLLSLVAPPLRRVQTQLTGISQTDVQRQIGPIPLVLTVNRESLPTKPPVLTVQCVEQVYTGAKDMSRLNQL